MVSKTCAICAKQFEVPKARSETAKYCSYACLGKSKSIFYSGEQHRNYIPDAVREKTCEHCGKVFQQRKSEPLSNFLKKKFCCKPCADKGGFRYLGKDHPNYNENAVRTSRGRQATAWGNAVKLRDGFKCRMCGDADSELHAHHIKPWLEHPELRYDIGNGITVCPPCHWKLHTAAQNENPVNSVEPLTGDAEGNTEPSFGRKPVEGVTTRGQTYRRWFGYCAQCKRPITKTWSDTKGKENLFCSKPCASTFNIRAGKIMKPSPTAVISSTSPGRESEDIV